MDGIEGIDIRVTSPEEYRAASAVVSTALMSAPANDEDWGKSFVIPSWEQSDSLSAWEGDRCVAHAAGYRFETLVPGGAWLATNGVTRIGVLATHRRRGLLRAMLTRLLTEAAERGQVLASLRASDTRIYQRFGFGLAGRCTEVTVTSKEALPITGTADGTMRLLAPDEVLPTVTTIYERAARRPGVLRRPEWMWQRYFQNAVTLGGDAEFVAVHTSADGIDDGFTHYMVKWKESGKQSPWTMPRGTGEVYDLWGTDPAVELALWEYLCSIDLVDDWYAEERPVDDVVQYAVTDTRAYRTRGINDEQWLRLLDVDAALAARRYDDVGGSFTVAVTDAMLPRNNGVWSISAAGAKRVDDVGDAAADIAADIGQLSAAYLGGTPWRSLDAAGRLDVRNPGAVAIADALFAVPDAPYCCSGF